MKFTYALLLYLIKIIFSVYTYSPFSSIINSTSFSYYLECISSCKVAFKQCSLNLAAFNGIYAAVSAANHSGTKIMTYIYCADATYLHLSICYLYISWHLHVSMALILSSPVMSLQMLMYICFCCSTNKILITFIWKKTLLISLECPSK